MAATVVDLATLDGEDGFRLDGNFAGDRAGKSISVAGDIDGDGFDDIIVGADRADRSAGNFSGEATVVFGKANGFAATASLQSLADGSDGFRLDGLDDDDLLGFDVSGVGDFNGDGVGDFIVGAREADPNGVGGAGESYLIFGRDGGGFPASVALDSLDGADGFRLDGILSYDNAGAALSSAGDINGDGFDDLIVGAGSADPNSESSAGEAYVVFGTAAPFDPALALEDLDGADGFRLSGLDAFDFLGEAVSGGEDVNGDGIDDLIVSMRGRDLPGRYNAGQTLVLFGDTQGFQANITPDALDGVDGFRIGGVAAGDQSGRSISHAGDVNGDGFGDIVIGATGAGDNGAAFIVFGDGGGFDANLNLAALNGQNGFRLEGLAASPGAGLAVSDAGDVNGDGFDDVIVSAPGQVAYGVPKTGQIFVVFGAAGGFDPALQLTDLDATQGFRLDGAALGDYAGDDVSGAGDVNGDGFADLVIGSQFADPGGREYAGSAFVVFGFDTGAVTQEGDDGADRFTGDANADVFIGGLGDDVLLGFGGADVLVGGAGDDALVVADSAFLKIDGGSGDDTLQIDAAGLFDLTVAGNHRIFGVENLEMNGPAPSVEVDKASILAVSDTTNTLQIDGDQLTSVTFVDAGWRIDVVGQNDIEIANGQARVIVDKTIAIAGDVGFAPKSIAAEALDGTNGFQLDGIFDGDQSGFFTAAAGDINGDGFGDVVTTARLFDGVDGNEGAVFVFFGKADGFAADTSLADLDGVNGFRLEGATFDDEAGYAARLAGDVNGDGFDDLIVGARQGGQSNAGESYVIFGKAGGFDAVTSLGSLDGTDGFRIEGVSGGDQAGFDVSTASDVNGDGFADVFIGARLGDPGGRNNAGESYVVFGGDAGFDASIALADLDGADGFRIDGIDASDYSGISVSDAGDVNGDGIDDLIVGAQGADPNGVSGAGESYIVFGRREGFDAAFALTDAAANEVLRIEGADQGGLSGHSVSAAGDFNGDGVDDFIVGAHEAGEAGEAYVIFGQGVPFGQLGSFGPRIVVSGLQGIDNVPADAASGFKLVGKDANDKAGFSVSAAGDVNGDGLGDLIVGAFAADEVNRPVSGEAYIVFGRRAGIGPELALADLDGTDGFKLTGVDEGAYTGRVVNEAGDVNGDGFDDVIVGAHRADQAAALDAGETYVIFGFDNGVVTHQGSAGADVLGGNAQANVAVLGQGADVFNARGGNDTARGGAGDDVVLLGAGADLGFGGTGDDILIGEAGDDILRGEAGDDELDLGAGVDQAFGGAGNDVIFVRAEDLGASDKIVGGEGVEDLLQFRSAGSANLAVLGVFTGIERVQLATGQTVIGSDDAITWLGRAGDETFQLGAGIDIVTAGNGADLVLGNDGDDDLSGQGGDDELRGGAGNDRLDGGTGADILDGGAGDDRLDGGTGADIMDGGAGANTYFIDNVGDQVIDAGAGGTVFTVFSFDLPSTFADLFISGNAVGVIGSGNALANHIVGSGTLKGGGGDDLIEGGASGSFLIGQAGDDTLVGGAGADLLRGDSGIDTLHGGPGDDTYFVSDLLDILVEESGVDTVIASVDFDLAFGFENLTFDDKAGDLDGRGNSQDNRIIGSVGANVLRGGGGDDLIFGGGGADFLIGQVGDDELDGGGGGDFLDGGAGADLLRGGAGNDSYFVDDANETIVEASGVDQVIASIAFSLPGGVENLSFDAAVGDINGGGNSLANRIVGTSGANTLKGGGADDVLIGVGGADFLIGQVGDDVLEGGAGDDILRGGSGADRVDGGLGDDVYFIDDAFDTIIDAGGIDKVLTPFGFILPFGIENLEIELTAGDVDGTGNNLANRILGSNGANLIKGGGGDDALFGLGGADFLLGHAGDDELFGGFGDDLLSGGAGADVLDGGFGDDGYIVEDSLDTIVDAGGFDTIFAAASFDMPDGIERLTFNPDAGDVDATGNGLANRIIGSDGANTLSGGAGSDRLVGNGGDDRLFGGDDFDRLFGGDGDDVLDGGERGDDLDGGLGNDIYIVDNIFERIVDSGGSDRIVTSVSFTMPDDIERLDLDADAGDIDGVGNDTDNMMFGNIGNNDLRGRGGVDIISGGDGADQLRGQAGDDILFGEDGADQLRGHAGDDVLRGDDGDDLLRGFDGSDFLVGGAGADNMDGGLGDDTYQVDDVLDTLNDAGGFDSVFASVSFNLGIDFEVLVLSAGDIDGRGHSGANTILGSDGANTLRGGGEDDLLRGQDGADILLGQVGDDDLQGEDGADSLFGAGGADTLNGGFGDDILVGQADADLFVFDLSSGRDSISDFQVGVDEIDVSDYGFADFAAILAVTSDINGRAEVALNGATDVITLFGVVKTDLSATDFGFA